MNNCTCSVISEHFVVLGPVSFADNPRHDVDFVVELGRDLGADELRGTGSGAPRDQPQVLVVAALLGG